jgi:hypothetical protein
MKTITLKLETREFKLLEKFRERAEKIDPSITNWEKYFLTLSKFCTFEQ